MPPPSAKTRRWNQIAAVALLASALLGFLASMFLPWTVDTFQETTKDYGEMRESFTALSSYYARTTTLWPLVGAIGSAIAGVAILLIQWRAPQRRLPVTLALAVGWLSALLMTVGAARLIGARVVESFMDQELQVIPGGAPYANLILGAVALFLTTTALRVTANEVYDLPLDSRLKRSAVRLPLWVAAVAAFIFTATPFLPFASEHPETNNVSDYFGEYDLAEEDESEHGYFGGVGGFPERAALSDAGQRLGWVRIAIWAGLAIAGLSFLAALGERLTGFSGLAWMAQVHSLNVLLFLFALVFAVLTLVSVSTLDSLDPGFNAIPILGSLTLLALAALYFLKVTFSLASHRRTTKAAAETAPPLP